MLIYVAYDVDVVSSPFYIGLKEVLTLEKADKGQIQIEIKCTRFGWNIFENIQENRKQIKDNELLIQKLDNAMFGLNQVGQSSANAIQGLTQKCDELNKEIGEAKSKLAALQKKGI